MKKTLAIFFLGLLSLSGAKPPNILVIMADDLGWYDTRFQGNEDLETPFLDRFVSEGMKFTDGYAGAPVCTPTRAAMMTGMSPARLHITNHAPGFADDMVPEGQQLAGAKKLTYLPLDATTLAERLKNEAGYDTGFVGKWHLSHRKGRDEEGRKWEPQLRPEHQGFDLNVGGFDRGGPPTYFAPYRIPGLDEAPEGEYLPDRLARECLKFLERDRDGPFFLTFWNYSVHYPIEAPADLIAKYEKRQVKNPAYAAMIEGMDRSIGRLLKALDELGLRDNTLVIFTSDNGSLFDNGPLRANKGHLYEGGIRVPWAVRWPGRIEAGAVSETPVTTTDVFPTVLEAAGLKSKEGVPLDCESLLPVLTGAGELQREAIYFHYPNYAFHKRNRLGSVIRKGRHKLIHFYDDDSVELYDLKSDLGESRDLAADQPGLAAALDQELTEWLRATGARMPYRPAENK